MFKKRQTKEKKGYYNVIYINILSVGQAKKGINVKIVKT